MQFFEPLLNWFLPKSQVSVVDTLDEAYYLERKNQRLYITFSLISAALLLVFSMLGFIAHRHTSTVLNLTVLVVLFIILLVYKKTALYFWSVGSYACVCITLIAVQHFVTPVALFTNLLWLPVIIFITSYLAGNRLGGLMGVYGGILFIFVEIFHHKNGFMYHEVYSYVDIMTSNIAAIIFSTSIAIFITYRMHMEERVIRKELLFREHEESDMNQLNTSLLSIVVHDIATPLTLVKNKAVKLRLNHKIPQDDPDLDSIISNIKVVEEIIYQARHLKAVKQGKIQVDLELVNLKESVQQISESLEHKLAKKNISIDFHYEPNEEDDFLIVAEKVSLCSSVICNLLSNAIKFSPSGASITIILSRNEDSTMMVIKDRGIGMPEALVKRLFDFAAPTSRLGTFGEKGTGFGLPILKTFIEAYGASVHVESHPIENYPQNHGTRFTLIFKNQMS